jgi:hypothetical protein
MSDSVRKTLCPMMCNIDSAILHMPILASHREFPSLKFALTGCKLRMVGYVLSGRMARLPHIGGEGHV